MFPVKSRKLALTLLCYVALALVLTDVAQARGNADPAVQRRAHVDLNRMVRKRAALEARQISVSSDPVLSPSSPSPPPSSSSNLIPSPSSSILSSSSPSSLQSSSSSSSSSVTSTSSIPTSTSSSQPLPSSSDTPPPTPSVPSDPVPTQSLSRNISTQTQTVISSDAGSPTSSSTDDTSSTPFTMTTTITIVIVIASVVAGVAIIWTLIRKWKFRPSAQFEDRMQPIDWQPAGSEEGTVPGLHRNASTASHGSFHSGGANGDEPTSHSGLSRSNTVLPEHDFTAGPAHLAPVGGYADLARGPSPQPQMQESLAHGPSLTTPAYDQYGVPLHHQGPYDAYNTAGSKY